MAMMDTLRAGTFHPEGKTKNDWVKTLMRKQPAVTGLIADATLNTGSDPETAGFAKVPGALLSRWQIFDPSVLGLGQNASGRFCPCQIVSGALE